MDKDERKIRERQKMLEVGGYVRRDGQIWAKKGRGKTEKCWKREGGEGRQKKGTKHKTVRREGLGQDSGGLYEDWQK